MRLSASAQSRAYDHALPATRSPDLGAASNRRRCAGLPECFVGREQLWYFVTPFEFALHPPASELAHLGAPRRVVQQLDDLRRKIESVVSFRVKRGALRRVAPLREIELHHRLAE